jgi:hypothetical protein
VLNLLVALSLFIPLLLAGSPLPPPPGSQHPQIHAVSARWDFDWELREPIVFVTADITVDGTSAPVRGSVEFSSIYPHLVDDWRIARGFPPRALDEGQIARFEQYTRSVLGCGWNLPAARVYDDPTTHNPNSPLSIAAIYPYGLDDWIITRAFAPEPVDRRQLRQFERYTVAILAC